MFLTTSFLFSLLILANCCFIDGWISIIYEIIIAISPSLLFIGNPSIPPTSYIFSKFRLSSYDWYLTKTSCSTSCFLKRLNFNYLDNIFCILTFSFATRTFSLIFFSLEIKPYLGFKFTFFSFF